MVENNDISKGGAPGVASENLRRAEENAASKSPEQSGDSVENVAESEEGAGGLYTGIGRTDEKKTKGKGFFKRKGPIALIVGLIFGIGGLSFFSISTELVAWKENIYSMFGQNSAVISRRSNFVMKRLLSTNRSTTTNTIFGNTKFKIRSGSSLQKKLSAQGIDYSETEVDGKKLRLLVYEDSDGRRIPIVASDSDIPRANKLVGTEIDVGDGVKVKLTDSSMTLTEARRVNTNFDTSYDTATLTFTGKIAGWFDDVVDSMYTRIIGKNARNQMDIDDPDEEKVNKALLSNASEGISGSGNDDMVEVNGKRLKLSGFKQERDGNGKLTGYWVFMDGDKELGRLSDSDYDYLRTTIGADDSIRVTNNDQPPDNAESALTAKAKKYAMTAASAGCAFLKGIGAISAAIGAVQTINVINYTAKYLELADKIKYGNVDETVHMALNNLNQSTKTTLYDREGNKKSVEGAVTESNGWNTVFSPTNMVDENDPSALFVNREYANKNAFRVLMNGGGGGLLEGIPGINNVKNAIINGAGALASFGASIVVFRACNALQGISGAISFIADVASLFTGGLASIIKDIIAGAFKTLKFALAMTAISTVVSIVTPLIANWFAGRLSLAFLGKTGGFSLLSGAQNIMGSNLQMSTGKYADKKNAIEVFALTKDVEKEWAAYERATKSPFDATSRYTFLGSIYNSILPIINTSGSGVTSVISSVAGLARQSAVSLISPSAMAANETDSFAASLSSEGNCGYLDAVGVVGDFACNKYTGAYVNELEDNSMTPEEVYKYMDKIGSFDGVDADGNPKINVKSDYAKYVVACVSSDTQPGTMGAAVQGFSTGKFNNNMLASGLINFGRNFVPFEGALDVLDAKRDEENIVWNSGLACTGNTNDANLNEKIKYFSMYNLDQRVLNNMGITSTNSTVAFLNDYYKENPIDYSFEGQIARLSGMSKEEVEDTLALIEYYNFIAHYDASERYAFGAPVVEEKHDLIFDNENQVANNTYIILLNDIEFADVRNRNFVV